MKKDAYKDIFQGWIAKAAEYKMALGIAVVCTVIILISLLWPKPKPAPTISAINSTPPASHVYTAPSSAPAPATAPVPAPQTTTTPPPPSSSPMEKELAAKPLFPPATATPAPKAQALPAPKPAAPAANPNTAVSLPAGWYVQLGSFQDKQRAIALAGKVEDKHWQSRIAPRPGGLHAVWVGPYPTRTAAEKAKLTLKKDIGISGFPVQSP
jgi:DedD protein